MMSELITIAPSILANSRKAVALNGTSSKKPPVEIWSTSLSCPSTIKAPVRPRRMRSRPSRNCWPGAIRARVCRKRSSWLACSLPMGAKLRALESCWHAVGHLSAEPDKLQTTTDIVHRDHPDASYFSALPHSMGWLSWGDTGLKSESAGLGQSGVSIADPADVA